MTATDVSNQSNKKKSADITSSCSVDINDYVFAHHCFMTGEYCSKQLNIQRERETLHRAGEINAFVIMSFTNMTDVVYKWRIRSYIESLTEFLYFKASETKKGEQICQEVGNYHYSYEDQEDITNMNDMQYKRYKLYLDYKSVEEPTSYEYMSELCCYSNDEAHKQTYFEELKSNTYRQELKVKKINVIRADSDPSSNFVICNRVCQQMQIADLIVVDVSDENTNVFYELGMAVALGKMILPICYSESYFKMKIPAEVEKEDQEYIKRLREREATRRRRGRKGEKELPYDVFVHDLEHHIDCYPWQRQLFEYFGLRYREIDREEALRKMNRPNNGIIKYITFERAVDKRFGFKDQKYDCFPYLESYGEKEITVGKKIYKKLQDSFNYAGSEDNTLILYTMDRFLNKKESGQCIVNYHKAIVEQLNKEPCFCGDRVGILVQPTTIAEAVKDAANPRHLLYNVGEIVQIGMNQATYEAHREIIKPVDFLIDLTSIVRIAKSAESEANPAQRPMALYKAETKGWAREVLRFTKNYIRNRSFAIYPHDPVYVSRVIKNGVQCDLLEERGATYKNDSASNQSYVPFFCLYHIMLNNLKYVNEVVVDISTNSVQSLFWLGAAHGSGVNAISIRHDMSQDEERTLSEATAEKGLSVPTRKPRNIFDISGLWTAVLHAYDTERFYRQLASAQLGIEQRTKLMLRDASYFGEEVSSIFWETDGADKENIDKKSIQEMYNSKKKHEDKLLESFYRSHFWQPMLRRNRLQIYSCTTTSENETGEPRFYAEKWDLNAISAFSYYLSKRKMIGEYEINIEDKQKANSDSPNLSLKKKNYICIGSKASPFSEGMPIPEYLVELFSISPALYSRYTKSSDNSHSPYILKGFENGSTKILTPHVLNCSTENNGEHKQTAQLLLWREDVSIEKGKKDYVFRASLAGSSGPATYALATLFVDETQKETAFGKKFYDKESTAVGSNERRYPLLFLQREVRKILIKKYEQQLNAVLFDLLKKEVHQEERDKNKEYLRKQHYTSRVISVTKAYLSTVLYRYFFPFLSQVDEKRICNGLELYIRSMMYEDLSPFKLKYERVENMAFTQVMNEIIVNESAKCAVDVLRDILSKLRLFEIIYMVDVSLKNDTTLDKTIDSRKIDSMIFLEKGSECISQLRTVDSDRFLIRCIFDKTIDKKNEGV